MYKFGKNANITGSGRKTALAFDANGLIEVPVLMLNQHLKRVPKTIRHNT